MFHAPSREYVLPAAAAAWVAIGLMGCGPTETSFRPNRVRAMSLEVSRQMPTDAALADTQLLLSHWFGTPDAPTWPRNALRTREAQNLVSVERLTQAAGSVQSDQDDRHSGLYQEHCVVCHGISGSGAGPAALFQSPYPRDFRAGIFKWKSTDRYERPTRDDLHRILTGGIGGSAMPSFGLLPAEDREALVDYVIYLAVRGEVERECLALAIDELDYDVGPPANEMRLVSSRSGGTQGEGQRSATDVLNRVVSKWRSAQEAMVPPDGTTDLAASIESGRSLFHGQTANCAACHGAGGTGGMTTLDHDDWTKEFTTRIGITPDDREATEPYRRAGALPPRRIDPRILAGGHLRGGHEPDTIFRRIRFGIAGTPMPGIELKDASDESTIGLSAEEIWDLVHYVQSIRNGDER
ncbi:MAG: cytochrome c [Planctomycetota bacterium]